jgi:GxxExxY protein
MPISPGVQTQPISADDFHKLDYQVMGLVFSLQRDLGRFWNEKIYQNELAYRCQTAGIERVAAEVPIHVSCEDFTKTYKIDLLIQNSIYELKTAQTLTSGHEKQTINYLMLTGLNHAKLVNMHPPSVQHRFISTNMTPEKRYHFSINDEEWIELDEDSVWLQQKFMRLLDEWGTFLEINLFDEAIIHFLGGAEKNVKEIEITNGARILGRQKVSLLNSNVAFRISALTKDGIQYENHLRRFIRYTSLKAIQWINFNHDNVVFKTILK